MNRNHHFQLNRRILTSVALISVAVAPLAALAESNLQKTGAKTATNPASIEIPRSTFVIPTKAGEGRDPFYPLSRRMMVEVQPDKGGEPPKVAPVSLTLKGIARADKERFALINDKTFASGEEGEVVMNNSRFRVHCIEIKEDSVIIEVNGVRQELRMRPGKI